MNIEKSLNKARRNLDEMEVPEELESRLKGALYRSKKKTRMKLMAVASIVIGLILISSFNYPAIAYYGRKILGFEQVVYGTLADLNELGMGQIVNETYTFNNGMEVTLDGVMIDDNQLVAFYTVKDPSGKSGYDLMSNLSFKGFWGNYLHQFGSGKINDDGTEVKWIQTFEAPKALERSLAFEFSARYKNQTEYGEIKFRLDRSKAMGTTVKQNINKTIRKNEGTIVFDYITASPTITKVSGELKGMDLSMPKGVSKDSQVLPKFEVILIVDGKVLESKGRRISSNITGNKFTFDYEGLLNPVSSMEILLYENVEREYINELIELSDEIEGKTFITGDREITISDITTSLDGTSITLESDMYFDYNYLNLIANATELYPIRMENHGYITDEVQGQQKFSRSYFYENTSNENIILKFEHFISYIEFNSNVIKIPVK